MGFITMDLIKLPLWLHHYDTYWILVMDVGLGSRWVEEWDKYIFSLNFVGIRMNSNEEIIWSYNATRNIFVNYAHVGISQEGSIIVPKWWFTKMWK